MYNIIHYRTQFGFPNYLLHRRCVVNIMYFKHYWVTFYVLTNLHFRCCCASFRQNLQSGVCCNHLAETREFWKLTLSLRFTRSRESLRESSGSLYEQGCQNLEGGSFEHGCSCEGLPFSPLKVAETQRDWKAGAKKLTQAGQRIQQTN